MSIEQRRVVPNLSQQFGDPEGLGAIKAVWDFEDLPQGNLLVSLGGRGFLTFLKSSEAFWDNTRRNDDMLSVHGHKREEIRRGFESFRLFS